MKTFSFPIFASLFFLFPIMAEAKTCVVHVDGYYRSNGTYVPPHVRACPNKTKNDNFGAAKHPGDNPFRRDKDKDRTPNYKDPDDDGNGRTDDVDYALRHYRNDNLSEIVIPELKNKKKYGSFPVNRDVNIQIIVFGDRTAGLSNSVFQWKQPAYMGAPATCVEHTDTNQVINVNIQYCKNYVGTTFAWKSAYLGDTKAHCEEVTPEGYDLGKVNNDYCRAYIGRYYDWTQKYVGLSNSLVCKEFAPNGLVIEDNTDFDACRRTVGSQHRLMKTVFDSREFCYELTLDTYQTIQKVDESICQYGLDANGNAFDNINGRIVIGDGQQKFPMRMPGIAEQLDHYMKSIKAQ